MDMKVLTAEFEKQLIAAIGQGLPLVRYPYQHIAEQLGVSEADVLEGLHRMMRRGDIKRMGVVVRHQKLGYKSNGMVVWDIPDDRVEELGSCIGQYDFVTLSYQRPRRLPDWPYNLFTMVHGRDRKNVMEQVDFIVMQCGLQNIKHEILFSRQCFKQRGAQYHFSDKTVSHAGRESDLNIKYEVTT